jgi:flagellar hook-basal body complex protein FliE
MTDFEKQLSKAMERVDAPENFAERVMQRAEVENFAATSHVRKSGHGAPKWWELTSWRWMTSPWAGGLVAAMLVAGVFLTGEHVHREHERQVQVQQATQQFETATQITDRALQRAREKMRRAGVDVDQ